MSEHLAPRPGPLPRRYRSGGAAARCDRLLDLAVLASAVWTLIYQACLVAHVGTEWAVAAMALAVGPCLAVAFAGARAVPEVVTSGASATRPLARGALGALLVSAALVAAVGFAFLHPPWPLVIGAWLVAAGAAFALAPGAAGVPRGDGFAVALVWALGLAAFSLFLVKPNADDTQYVHLSAWVAAHGAFPVRDTLFSDQALPAIFYPPLTSYEALLGSIARTTGLPTRDLAYLGVPPAAGALAVLALWRLLRTWRVRAPALALSVALAFLLLDAATMKTLGSFWLTRLWQGKVIFVALLVPVLFALLHEYAERPTRRGLLMLVAAGAAGVGLTTTAIFVVPVVAAGCAAALLRAAPRRAAAALLAAAAYPLAAGIVTLALGGRNPQVYTAAEVVPWSLAHDVLGTGALAFIALAAVLAGPALIPSATGARMSAGTALVVGALFVPGVTLLIFHVTGLGEVLWRLTWALPVAALVGVLGGEALQRSRRALPRLLPAVAVTAALVAWGAPLWSPAGRSAVARSPQLKVDQLARADRVLAVTRPGDVVLATRRLSRTLLQLSGSVVTVNPNDRYVEALRGVPGGHADARLLLGRFARQGLGRGSERAVVRALRVLRVDLACVLRTRRRAWSLLTRDGYRPVMRRRAIGCLRRGPGPTGG